MIWLAARGKYDSNGDRSHRRLMAVTQLIEVTVGGGQSIFVQVEDSAAGPVTRGIDARSVTIRASQTFEDAISRVRPAAEAIVAQLRSLAAAPDEVQVEFGLTLSAEAGGVYRRGEHRGELQGVADLAPARRKGGPMTETTWAHPVNALAISGGRGLSTEAAR
jgi:hypothetical protein